MERWPESPSGESIAASHAASSEWKPLPGSEWRPQLKDRRTRALAVALVLVVIAIVAGASDAVSHTGRRPPGRPRYRASVVSVSRQGPSDVGSAAASSSTVVVTFRVADVGSGPGEPTCTLRATTRTHSRGTGSFSSPSTLHAEESAVYRTTMSITTSIPAGRPPRIASTEVKVSCSTG
jgi:hypothetical protein